MVQKDKAAIVALRAEVERLEAWLVSIRTIPSDVAKTVATMTTKALDGAAVSRHQINALRSYRVRVPRSPAGTGQSNGVAPGSNPACSVAASCVDLETERWRDVPVGEVRTLFGGGVRFRRTHAELKDFEGRPHVRVVYLDPSIPGDDGVPLFQAGTRGLIPADDLVGQPEDE